MVSTATDVWPAPSELADFVGLAQRALEVEPAALIRFRVSASPAVVSGFVRLPFDVLAGRTVALTAAASVRPALDSALDAAGFIRWCQGGPRPLAQDSGWLEPLPPREGWRRVEVVPGEEVRQVIAKGKDLADTIDTRARQQSLLSSTALAAADGSSTVNVPLSALSALTRMAFLPADGDVALDVTSGWCRLAAPFGSTYVATSGGLLSLLR